jgi:hypothetical protein
MYNKNKETIMLTENQINQINSVLANKIEASLVRVNRSVDNKRFEQILRLNFNTFLEFVDADTKHVVLDATAFPVDVRLKD